MKALFTRWGGKGGGLLDRVMRKKNIYVNIGNDKYTKQAHGGFL